MSQLLRETIDAAERAVTDEDSQVRDCLERLLASPGELHSGEESQRVYLAALLDFLGMREESVRVLREAPGAISLNMEGMLAAAHGRPEQARNLLLEALAASTRSPLPRKQVLANLAALSLQAGSLRGARAWVEEAALAEGPGRPATDVLIATVRASIAVRQGDLSALRDAAASLKEASKARLAELGTEHPEALAVVANMASTEIMLARADNSAARLERAIHVLDIATLRLAAEFGIDHPQTRAAMASLAAARTVPAAVGPTALATDQANTEELRPAVPDHQMLLAGGSPRVVLIGPPGAGKGTQAQFLVPYLSLPRISISDIFRHNVTHHTELGAKAKEYMDRGDLVPDEITIAMVRDRLAEDDAQLGFLLDGFPRNVPQAETLNEILAELDAKLGIALELVIKPSEVVRRLSGRRTCRRCGRAWHVVYDLPSREGICDDCGGDLFQPDDDKEDIIRQRLDVYYDQTAPLAEFYAAEGILARIDATGSVEEVTMRVLSVLEAYFRA